MKSDDKLTILAMLGVLLTVKSSSDITKAQKHFSELRKKSRFYPMLFANDNFFKNTTPKINAMQYESLLKEIR
jgi:hypothetical protein